MAAVNGKDGLPAYITENHYGWTFVPFLQGFGGNVFRNPPDDLYPTLDSAGGGGGGGVRRQAAAQLRPAAGAGLRRTTRRRTRCAWAASTYSNNNHAFLRLLGEQGSRVAETSNFGLMPAGPEGPLPRHRLARLGHPDRLAQQGRGLGVHQVGDVEGAAGPHGGGEGLRLDHPRLDPERSGLSGSAPCSTAST